MRYDQRGVSASKEDVHNAIKNIDKGIFPKALGKKLGALQRLREKSDYDDFYIASKEKAEEQIVVAKEFLQAVKDYLE